VAECNLLLRIEIAKLRASAMARVMAKKIAFKEVQKRRAEGAFWVGSTQPPAPAHSEPMYKVGEYVRATISETQRWLGKIIKIGVPPYAYLVSFPAGPRGNQMILCETAIQRFGTDPKVAQHLEPELKSIFNRHLSHIEVCETKGFK